MKKIFKIIIYFIGLWIFATLAKENIYILIFGIGVILWWGMDQLEKKTNENSMNFLIRIESCEVHENGFGLGALTAPIL